MGNSGGVEFNKLADFVVGPTGIFQMMPTTLPSPQNAKPPQTNTTVAPPIIHQSADVILSSAVMPRPAD